MNLAKEIRSNLLFILKTQLPIIYTLVFGSKKVLFLALGKSKESSALKKQRISLKEFKNCFSGYYDVSPFHPQKENLIVFLANNQNPYLKPSAKHKCVIVLYNLIKNNYKILTECNAWNWQQGNRLQWLNETEIIYNDYLPDKDRFVTKILNVNTGHGKTIDEPFQSIHNQFYFLSIDYNILFKIRSEYAYQNSSSRSAIRNNILRYDFKSAVFHEIVDLTEIREFLELPDSFNPKYEHINHILISPNGNLFIFIYRFIDRYQRRDFLMSYDLTSRSLQTLVYDEMVSHCTWKDDENLLFWGSINNKRGYFSYNFKKNSLGLTWQSNKDGHPNFIGKAEIITDTYPDRNSDQILKKINFESEKEDILASIYHPPFFELHTRCDLHPSLSKSGKYVQVDTLSNRRREIIIFENEMSV